MDITKSRLNYCGIYEAYHDLTLETYPGPEENRHRIQEYIEELSEHRRKGRGLLLIGPNGTGKTCLGSIVLRAAMEHGYTVRLASWPRVIESRTQSWRNPDLIEEFRAKIYDPEFLQLDDLGKETAPGKELSVSTLDLVLRTRAQRLRPTIITANADPKALESTYGPSIHSLLSGHCRTLIIEGPDLRLG